MLAIASPIWAKFEPLRNWVVTLTLSGRKVEWHRSESYNGIADADGRSWVLPYLPYYDRTKQAEELEEYRLVPAHLKHSPLLSLINYGCARSLLTFTTHSLIISLQCFQTLLELFWLDVGRYFLFGSLPPVLALSFYVNLCSDDCWDKMFHLDELWLLFRWIKWWRHNNQIMAP